MTSFNLADLFEITADTIPDRPRSSAGAATRTYAELDERANRFGQPPVAAGIVTGEHIAMLAMEPDRVARSDARRVQGPGRADQPQLPLHRR